MLHEMRATHGCTNPLWTTCFFRRTSESSFSIRVFAFGNYVSWKLVFGNSVLQMCFAGLRRFHQREGVSQTSWLQQDRVAFKMYIIVCATSLPEECFKKKHVTTFLLFAPARPPVRGVCMFLPVRLDWTLKLSELELYVCIRVLVTSCHTRTSMQRSNI